MRTTVRLILLGLLICLSCRLQAQDQYDYTWLLGTPGYNHPELFMGGDLINFNDGTPSVTYFDLTVDLWVPCVASDKNGLLQFYSNGCQIMNHQHQLMENGYEINSGPIHDQYCINTGYPAGNSLLFLPFPGHEDEYYHFHMRQYADHRTWDLLWSRIDMKANGGLGKVLEKNMPLIQDTLMPSVSAVRHGNGRDWWIIVGEQFNDDMYCLLLDTFGVHPATKIRYASWIAPNQYPSFLCFSPDGKKMARGGHGTPAAFRLYDFDRCSGTLSNPVTIQIPEAEAFLSWPCFSPNSRYLYLVNQLSRLYQYDTWAADINASVQLVGEHDGFLADYGLPTTLYTMTTGPDQRIYMSANNGTRYLHTIHKPNEPGLACDFRQHDFQMPAIFPFFLPNMPFYRLYNEPGSLCDTLGVHAPLVTQWRSESDSIAGALTVAFTDISYFQPTSWHWTFGDGDTSLLPSPTHAFPAPGEYNVCLAVCNEAGLCDTLCRKVTVRDTTTSLPAIADKLHVSAWPNPANTWLWLAHPDGDEAEFQLFDLAGRLVVQQKLPNHSGIERVAVAHLAKGLYFWQLCHTGRQVKSGKIIIQKN